MAWKLKKEIKPDPVRIKEINEAFKDKSGRQAEKLLLKYLKEL